MKKMSKSYSVVTLLEFILLPVSLLWALPAQPPQKTATETQTDQEAPPIKYSPVEGEVHDYQTLPNTLKAWQQFKKKLEETYGTSLGILILDTHQQALDGPGQGEGRNLVWYNITANQRLWEGGKFIFKVRGGNTDGSPPNGLTPLVGTKLNLDWAAYATTSAYIANVYLEQKLLDDKLTVSVGKITFPSYFDENKVAGWDFFSHSLARNQMFPHRYHTIGVITKYDVTDALYVQAGVTDGEGIRSETGLNTTFNGDNYFITMGEIGIKTQDSEGRESNFRFDVWHDNRLLTRNDGTGSESGIVGFGFNCDRMLTDQVGVFGRYGIDNGEVRTFEQYWSIGATCKAPLSGRDNDALGFGMGQGLTDGSYRTAKGATRSETIFETYYRYQLHHCFSILFDLQVLLNPGVIAANDTSVIPGVRLKGVF